MLTRNIFPIVPRSRFLLCKYFSCTRVSKALSSSSSGKPETLKNIEVMDVGRVRVIGLNRPKQRNAVNRQTARELYDAFFLFDKDDNVDVAVLYGKGGNFCAGYDLKEIAGGSKERSSSRNPPDPVRDLSIQDLLQECSVENGIGPMGPSRLFLGKPVVAAVSGYAVAGGLELSLMCDLRVVEENAIFGVFCRRFGVPLIDGGTVRLPALIGLSRALDMILTGRPVPAQEALSMGLANRIVPRGKSLDEALQLASQIASFPQDCMKIDRMSAYHSTYHNCHGYQTKDPENWLQEALSYEYSHGIKVLEKESMPGAQKFVEGFGRKGQPV